MDIRIEKWFPIHFHRFPHGVSDFSLVGGIVSVEWNPKLLKKYYNWESSWPEEPGERIIAFLENWKYLASHNQLASCNNMFFSVEGESSLGNLNLIPQMKEKGVIAIQIFHQLFSNDYCIPSSGLTLLGKKLLKILVECNIYLDLSHLQGTILKQILANFIGKKIVSHVVCEDMLEWSLVRRSNAMSEDEIKACDADLYGVPFIDDIVSPEASLSPVHRNVSIELVARHIDRISQIVGSDRVALAPDYFDFEIVRNMVNAEVQVVPGLDTVNGLRELSEKLGEIGYASFQIENIFYKNAERITQNLRRL